MRTQIRKASARAGFLFLLSSVAAAASPSRGPQFLQIEAQALDRALNSWAQQTGYSVLIDAEDAVGAGLVQPLSGVYTAEAALKTLLENRNLQYEFVNARTVAVRAAGSAVMPLKGDTSRSRGALERDLLTNQDGDSDASASASGSYGDDSSNAPPSAPKRGIPEVLVTGSKSLDTDVRRSKDDARPYVVIDHATIEQSGATNVDSLLKSQLTMATSSLSSSQTSGGFGNTSKINLRGLGSDETLILIDGRRLAGYGNSGSPQQPDINGIPLSAIERIEVLPATASGIYGGSATGGVVNIILRRDYTGLEGQIVYGNTFDNDSFLRRANLSSGFNLEGGRTVVLLSASWSDNGDLLTKDRDFARRARDHIVSINPTGFYGSANPPLGGTTNIRSANGSVLTLKASGASLGSPITFIPYGYAGPSSDGGAALIANAGHYNLDLPDTAQGGTAAVTGDGNRLSLLNAPTVKSILGTVRRSVAPWLDAFIEASASENSASFARSPGLSAITISAAAPANPFSQSIRIVTPTVGLEQDILSDIKTRRAAAGLIFKLHGAWSAGLDYTWNQVRDSSSSTGFINTAGAVAAIGTGTLNVFRDTNAFPVDFASVELSAPFASPSNNTLKDSTFRTSGPLSIALPGGQPTLSVLLEHRKELFEDQLIIAELGPGIFNYSLNPSTSQRVDSLYLETLLPLISPRQSVRGVRVLEFELSGRHDRYRTTGVTSVPLDAALVPRASIVRTKNDANSTDPSLALRYGPTRDLTFRASYGTGFLPPSVAQLVPAAPVILPGSGLTDPQRNNEPISSYEADFGGNPGLSPEESKSWAGGFILTPRVTPGLRLSVDWIEIKKKNNISALRNTQADLNNLINFAPNRITRGPSTGGIPGPITKIDFTLVNLARLKSESYDVSVDYQLDTARFGSWNFRLGATRLVSLETQSTAAAPLVDYTGVGTAGNVGSASDAGGLKWSANSALTWHYHNVTLGWNTRFFDSYFLNVDHTINPNQGSATIPSQIYHDLFASYKFSQLGSNDISLLHGTEVQLGVQNVFNTRPPLDVVGRGVAAAGYSYYGDPRLANYYVTIKKNFGGK